MARELMDFGGRHFIFDTKFSDRPDKFGNEARYAYINLTDEEAADLKARGFNVKQTEETEKFKAEWYTKIIVKYGDNSMLWPKVYLKADNDNDDPYLYSPNNIGRIDDLWISNVDVVCAPYEYRPGEFSLYVRFMYLTQNISADPYHDKYFRNRGDNQ